MAVLLSHDYFLRKKDGRGPIYNACDNAEISIPLFNITGVSDLYFMENHDGFELEKTENQSIWLIKANRSFDFESLPKQQNIGFKVQCEDSEGSNSYTVTIQVTNQYEHVDIALKAIKTSFDISSTVSPVTVSVPENTNNLTSILSIAAEARLEGGQYLLWNQSDDMVEWDFAGSQKKISLTLKKELEYKEDKHLFPIIVRTWIENHPDSNQTMLVKINVTDVDDKNPKFDHPHYTGSIPENAASNTQVKLNKALEARDQDVGINATINYELILFTDSVFKIDGNSSVISLKEGHSLDRENMSVITLVVRAYQVDKPEFRRDIAMVEISITDVNDNAPVMSQASYTASIPENMKNGQVVTWVKATDADEGPNAEFVYKLENCNGSFEINQAGSIIVKNSTQLDMEKTRQFNCIVYAQESKTAERKISSRSSLTVNLTDVNDNNPEFVNKSYSFKVTDNPTEQTAIGQVNANDADVFKSTNGYVTYELSVQKENLFKMNDSTGELYSLNNPLYDCERSTKLPKSVELAVTASDSPEDSGTERRTTVSVTVNIQTNLCPPVLSIVGSNVSSHSIPEDITPGSPLLTIQVFDADPDDSSLFFDISGDHEPFQLNKTRKNNMVQLSVSSALDRERKEQYSFTVQANDTKHVISWNFTFDITDVNDNAPVFSQLKYSVNITEETTQNTIITVQATDNDLQNTDNSNITYTLVPSKWSDKFTIDASSGALNLVKKIDADEMGSNKTLELVVIAKDQGIPSLNSTTLIHVTVEDINDHPPVFSEAPQNLIFTFNETENPQNFFTAKATDKDADDKVFYKLTNATEAFHINKRTGRLSANRTLQWSDRGVVVIEAYNGRNYSNKTIQNPKLFIEINIKDINNNSPVFTPNSYAENISEGSPVGSEIGSVNATDSDWSEEFGSVYYWITDGNSESHFFLNELNGTLYLANTTDYEKETKYNLTITALDSRELSQTITNHRTTAFFVINILDVNDNSPKFTQDLYQCSVKESTLDFACQVKAEDKDLTSDFSQIDYQLVNGSDSKFQIIGDGEIKLKQMMDYDAGDHSFILTVKAIDRNESSLTSMCNVMITVNDTNDEEPEFQQSEYKFSVGENQDSGTEVGVVRAVDRDSNSVLSYSIKPVNENFSVNSSSGIITTRKKFDYESKASYNFTVNVSDGNHTNTTSVYVEIRDMNDNAPAFNASVYKAYIPETDVNKVILKNISSLDADKGQTVTYTLENYKELFSINSTTGVLSLMNDNKTLDYESQQTYVLSLTAKDDGDPPLSGEATVEVHLTDVDDTCPVFTRPVYTVAIKENKTYPSILQVSAQDKDTPPNKLVYKVKNNEKFTFNGSKLVMKENTTLDVDNHQPKVINVTVTVTDNSAIHNCSNTSTIQITVENINDNPPVIDTSSCVQPIAQNFSGTVCNVSASDADLNSGDFTFFLTQSYGIFSIETNTGELSVLPNQTLKANFTYNVNIVVSDHGSPPLMSQDNINIFVIAANNFPPLFSNKTATVNIEEHLFPHSVYNMTATDGDIGKEGGIRYKLVEGDSAFKINQLTGEITLNTLLICDRPNKHYILKVEAKDQGFNPMSSTGTVTVNVINVNDKPEFIDIDYNICVNPPIEVNTRIAQVIAKDTDSMCTGNKTDDQITYSLIDPTKNFKINDQGEIMAAQNITSQSFIYSLEIVATDVHGLNNSKTYNISSGQKGEPVIKPKVTEVRIFENHTINTAVTKISATGDGEISYNITKTSKLRDAFSIDPKTGEISLIRELDRERDGNLVEMIIEASNKNGSCTSQVIIHIEDVNNKSPYFVDIPYNLQIQENSPGTDQCILNISAGDPDLNNQLTFSIVNATLDVFNISTIDGEPNQACLQIKRALDAETDPNDISLWVKVNDGIHSNDTEVKVTVLDINDNWPKFNKSYSFNVSEDVSLGRLKSDIISAYDRDGLDKNKLRYAIISNDSESLHFGLDPQSGVLSVVHKLDRETKEAYSLDVTVHDSWKNHTVSTFVNITVLDINDNTPTFVNKTMTNSVLEGSDSKQLTIPLTVTDPDSGENGTVTFTLVDNYDGHFKLENESSHTAKITVVKELDREAKGILITSNGSALYTLEVVAADQGKPSLSSTGTVQIYVTDINDCTPEFEKTNMGAEVMEGSKEGFSVYRVTATDCDYNPEYKNLTYNISGADQEYFSIEKDVYGDFQVGVIKLKKQISIDIKETYVININVTDGVNSNQTSLTITVVDVNDHDPEFSESLYNFSTPETDDQPQGDHLRVKVGQVNATDRDPYKNGEISYRIVTSDVENLFNITQDGDVFLIGEVDRDQCTNHRYTFTVIAEDEGSPKRTGFTEVVVNITDVNDNSPVFKKTNYTGSVKENSPNGSSVLFNPPISAEDEDESINGTVGIRFFITRSDAAELPFTIDKTTGRILVNNSAILDRETKSNYTILVEARDREGGHGCRSNTTNVIVNVLDANDNLPQFTNTSYSFSVLEDAEYGELVGSVTAQDPDLNSVLTYYITSGGDGHFSINDKTSGNITVSKNLDREKKANYSLVVRVTDEKHHRNVTVLIILEDVNDNSPVFSSSLLRVSETEERNVSYPKQIFTLKATDADEGLNAEIKYFLNTSALVPASNITKLFFLNETGELFLRRKLNREEKDKYPLSVYAMDGGNRTTPATVEVLVLDINDNDPVFYNHDHGVITNYSASVLEMSPVNSIIYLPVCRDKDAGENGTISFSLRSQIPSVNDLLAIDPVLGTVSIKSPISVNSLIHITNGTDQNSLIHITNGTDQTVFLTYIITATDGGSLPHSTNFTLELVVKNINDNAPVFEKPRYNFSIPENATANTAVGEIKAFVVNETFHHLTYSMIEQADASSNFTVTSEGKVYTKGVLDRETKGQVTFAAKVVDGRVPERTAFTVVAITLEDVNDNSPSFEKSDYQYTVTENDVNPPPLIVTASDRDEGENAQLTYSLIGDTGVSGKFVLNGTTGTLGVNGSLDREVEPYYYLQIRALDKGYPQLSSVVNVTVRVCDINDHSPKFNSSQLTRNISENLSGIQTIATVRADDPDAGLNGTVVYELEDDHGLFQIDSLNGMVFCTRPLDYEEQAVYNLTIIATDMGSPPHSSHTNLVLYVTNVPDNRPTFSNTLYEVNASISDSVGKSLLNLTAGDRTSYTITGGNQEKRFSLNKDTGEVKVQRSLAHGQAEYLLSVEAKDTDSNLTATTKVLVNVVDLATLSSSVPHYTASLMENSKETVVVFNLTSRDQYGAGLEYRIVRTDPPVAIGYFYVTSGQVYCNQSVDRETISLITLHIESTEIQLSQGRKKRSARSGDIILEVNIGDENDNPPSFSAANVTDSLVFGVPSGAQPGDLVGVIKAVDPDSVSAGRVRYNISGGDLSQFYVYPTTGQIVVRQALYRDPRTDYTLMVTATDEDGKNDTANVTVLVVPSSSSVILTVPFANDQMMSHKQNLAQNLSELIGYKCEFEKTTTHTENNRIEPCRTDVILHCIDPAKNFVVPKYLVQGIIQNKSQEVTALFCRALVDPSPCGGCDDVTVQRIPLKHSSKISTTEIALIVIGALILIGGSVAIALILASPQKDDEDKSDKQPQNNVDMWELESMATASLSKATGAAAGVVNPMFTSQEVENTQTSPTAEAEVEEQSNSEKNTTRKRATSYESQEVILDFQEDVIDDDGNHQINHSNADSGVENESDSSHSGSIQTVNEMEASGRPSEGSEGGAEGGIEIKGNSYETNSPGHERKSIFIAMETGDTTDDEISYDGSIASGGDQEMNEEDSMDGGVGVEETEESINQACDETGELSKPSSGVKSVTFKPGPPVVEEYEALEDEVTCL